MPVPTMFETTSAVALTIAELTQQAGRAGRQWAFSGPDKLLRVSEVPPSHR